MKLVGLSGAQGAGKSTLLSGLKDKGWNVDSFRVSRAVQAELGWDNLDRVMESPESMIEFQQKVFRQKLKNDSYLSQLEEPRTADVKDRVILTERTFADIDAYTTQWTWRFVDKGKLSVEDAFKFISQYHIQCYRAQILCYDGTIMLPFMDHIIWEDDPNRASKNDVTLIYEHIDRFMQKSEFIAHPKFTITAKSIKDRIEQTELFLERF